MTKTLLLFSAFSIGAASAGDALRITGPFTHDNLSIFLLHDKKPVSGKPSSRRTRRLRRLWTTTKSW